MQVGDQNKPRDASRVLFLCRFPFFFSLLKSFLRVGSEIRFLSPFFISSISVRSFCETHMCDADPYPV